MNSIPPNTLHLKKFCLNGIISMFLFTLSNKQQTGGMTMRKRHPHLSKESKAAPTYDEEQSFGEDATEEEVKQGEATMVTRLVYDEYDPSEE
jgi:hypothetical protein